MNIIKNIILFFKNIFYKQEDVKLLEAPKQVISVDNKGNFIQSLRTSITEKKEKKIETLICSGNGLGIQKKISS